MEKIFICSPLKGNIERNLENARKYCRFAVEKGYLPIAPHLIFTQFLSDLDPQERKLGIQMGIELLTECKEVWVFCYGEPSSGMQSEIEVAKVKNIPVKFIEMQDDI